MTALILYWVYSIYWYDMVFQAGIFLYTSILFWHLLQKTSRDSQFRMEQLVYEKNVNGRQNDWIKKQESI